MLRRLIRAQREIVASEDFEDGQLQPASIDLRLGPVAWRVRASFLPGPNATVEQKLASVVMHEIDLKPGAVLETGCVYIVPLLERAEFSVARLRRRQSQKLDRPHRRLHPADHRLRAGLRPHRAGLSRPALSPRFPRAPSRCWCARARASTSCACAAARRNSPTPSSAPACRDARWSTARPISTTAWRYRSICKGEPAQRIGWRAKRHTGVIDVDRRDALAPLDYWDPIEANPGGNIILDPDEFYILASREAVAIPPDYAAEMVPFNPLVGEFRVHYAGFFDPGFGYETGQPPSARGVLEVRSREVPFILEHGQIIGRLVFERLTDPPPEVYGEGLGSNYQRQGLKLSKHFREI